MPVTVNINGLTCVHQGSVGVATATLPDVCKTPPYAVPLPYPNIAMSSDLVGGTVTVSVDGSSAAVQSSLFVRSTGDEAGSLGGVVSQVFAMHASFLSFSPTVLLEGQPACRLTDKMLMNAGNTVCLGGALQVCLADSTSTANEPQAIACEEPRFCKVYSVELACGHGERAFYHDLVKQDLAVFRAVSGHDEPDKLIAACTSECEIHTEGCAALWVRETPNGAWAVVDPVTQEVKLEPPYLSFEVIHIGQVFAWLFDPLQIVRRTYRLQTVICNGGPEVQTPVTVATNIEVYPEAELSGKAYLKYAHPEIDGTSGSFQYKPESTWTFGGEIKGKIGKLEKTYAPATDPEAATALPLFGSLLNRLGKMTVIFKSMQKYGLDFKGEILPPSWEFTAGVKLVEVPGQAGVGAEGSFGFGFNPLIGLQFSVSLLDYLIRFAGGLGGAVGGPVLAQALIQLKAKFATDPNNPNRGALDVDITLTATTSIFGTVGLTFAPTKEADATASVGGKVGLELKGLLKGHGKVWTFQAAAGGEVGARDATGKEPSEISATLKPVKVGKGRYTMQGELAFNGLAVYYLFYAEVGAAGAVTDKKAAASSLDKKAPKASSMHRVFEKKGLCVLLEPWKWSPAKG